MNIGPDSADGQDVRRLHNTVSRVQYEQNAKGLVWPHSVAWKRMGAGALVSAVILVVHLAVVSLRGPVVVAVYAGQRLGLLALVCAMYLRTRTPVIGRVGGAWITDRPEIVRRYCKSWLLADGLALALAMFAVLLTGIKFAFVCAFPKLALEIRHEATHRKLRKEFGTSPGRGAAPPGVLVDQHNLGVHYAPPSAAHPETSAAVAPGPQIAVAHALPFNAPLNPPEGVVAATVLPVGEKPGGAPEFYA